MVKPSAKGPICELAPAQQTALSPLHSTHSNERCQLAPVDAIQQQRQTRRLPDPTPGAVLHPANTHGCLRKSGPVLMSATLHLWHCLWCADCCRARSVEQKRPNARKRSATPHGVAAAFSRLAVQIGS